jgi:hypothetical protein
MKEYFVVEVIKSLNKKEIKEFKVFLSSPFFNNKKYLIDFFKKLSFYHPNYYPPKFSMDKFKRKLNYSENTFRAIQSKLTKLLIEYLTYKNIDRNVYNKNNHMFNELIYRNLLDIFNARSSKFDKYNLSFIKKDSFYYFDLFLHNSFKINYQLSSREFLNKKEKVSGIINNINNSYKYLYVFFLTSAISDYINYLVLYYDYDINVDNTFLKQLIEEINTKSLNEYIKEDNVVSSFFNIYMKLLECFKDISNENKYESYKSIILKKIENMNSDERNFHLTNLMNLCLLPKETNEIDLVFERKVFDLYKVILEKEYFLDSKNRFLPLPLYRAILIVSINLKKFEWAEKFILLNSKKVSPDQIDNIRNFGLAYLYNSKLEYETSLKYLYKIKIDRFIYKYDVRDMNLKMLYEMNDIESVLTSIHNYKEFLRTNEFSSREIKLFRGNFVKFVEKLTYFKSGNKNIDVGYIRKLILKAKHISNRNWLLEKVNELNNESFNIDSKYKELNY